MAVKIFVEGIADIKFLKDYVSHRYNINLGKEDINETKGWTNIRSTKSDGESIKNQMIKNTDNEDTNLLIFDADSDYKKRYGEINDWKNKDNLEFEIFLWPNNSDSGDLETILEKIINLNNSAIFDCWDDYENCLKTKTINGRNIPLTTPASKTKIYGYLESLLGESKSQKDKIKEKNRNYKNVEHWNLDSEHLAPLKLFLDNYFQ